MGRIIFFEILLMNTLQVGVAYFWFKMVIRLLRPLSPVIVAKSLEYIVVFPVVVIIIKTLLVVSGSDFAVQMPYQMIRLKLWNSAIWETSYWWLVLMAILAGSTFIFVFQEFIILGRRGGGQHLDTSAAKRDDKLELILKAVLQGLEKSNYKIPRYKKVEIFKVEDREQFALLKGIFHHKIYLSSALIDTLDEEEVMATVAHEVAHVIYGDNLRTLLIWSMRALQPFNPFTLAIFRDIIEVRESACDYLASEATKNPMALASALIKMQGEVERVAGEVLVGAEELARREQIYTTKNRVNELLHLKNNRFNKDPFIPVMVVIFLLIIMWGIT
ncbi:MAG: hypothetical protein A2504_07360 [Bdellovibrionales bacterium RIFOXYD12_FULL_39_22]|nr:MAG: hypothetical protein A2385_16730 [Bdellovibrionales bacterium RIFOXYB1_FULL_39_21]OFZ44695.1 MAG: hypothetical protein A2485_14590 [Bdellovibrionales bacterium RIFOXYC12_FULL_39_17]OFZ49325.1 MAG: hypothetical protein A2404_08885 [Bdellovibrionales bacterium RIFOXYC1_FULL_39_130]OFZ77061.1 MAG: hypothetical protein A2560_09850 [Bdellovibrionales bacterium RIFOXYD1_FULL_39_84]OFZ95321.1 MAG: hypothetical protein A2504_07360 [Bdellovibrionales bacterium RIFOXYD12_FULL_39_22]HLE13062.1 M5